MEESIIDVQFPEGLLEQYASVCDEEKIVAAKKKVLKEQIEELIGQRKYENKTPAGSYVMVPKTTYTFSADLIEEQENVKIRQQDEIEEGIAIPETNYSLRFNTAKK